MAEGAILTELHNRLAGLDGQGNLILDTKNKMPESANLRFGFPILEGAGIPSNVLITNGVGASANIANVSFQVVDKAGVAVPAVLVLDIYLSDAATGIGLTATTASGGIAAVSADGTILGVETTSKALRVVTNASGLFELAITDTAKTGFYPVATLGSIGAIVVGAQLTTASYHS